MMGALASLSLALATAGQLLDCSYAAWTHQAAGEVVVTTAVEETAGSFEALLSPRLDRVALGPPEAEPTEAFACAAVERVAVCTASRDRKAFVLFLDDGRFSLSVQGEDATGWTTTSGRCARRKAPTAI